MSLAQNLPGSHAMLANKDAGVVLRERGLP